MQLNVSREDVALNVATGQRLNRLIREHSGGASLVVMSLPLKRAFPPCKFVNYTQTLTRGLQRVILVRGSGREVVTTYA